MMGLAASVLKKVANQVVDKTIQRSKVKGLAKGKFSLDQTRKGSLQAQWTQHSSTSRTLLVGLK